MRLNLINAICSVSKYHNVANNTFNHPEAEFCPGYLVVLAAHISRHRIQEVGCVMPHNDYLKAIAWHKALWGEDRYRKERRNIGHNYSLMTPLINPDSVDDSTTSINSCIRTLACKTSANCPEGISALIQVVGELHDNVWSHGLSTGFSFAQKWAVPGANPTDHYIEFALADHGKGFLAELKRASIPDIQGHDDAIRWCIQEGNSSKHADLQDDWAQSIPSWHSGGNLFGSGVTVKEKENNHQGLGLYHLLKLIKSYNGELLLATGDVCLSMKQGRESYKRLPASWQGVAISCRFKVSELSTVTESAIDADVMNIMKRLREGT